MSRQTIGRIVLTAIAAGGELLKIAVAALVYAIIKPPLVEAAAMERGYRGAVGGEWMLIILVVALTYCATAKFVNHLLYAPPKSKTLSPKED